MSLRAKLLIPASLAILSFFGGLALGKSPSAGSSGCDTDLHFINPLLACRDRPFVDRVSIALLQDKLRAYIDEKTREGVITDASVYFRDLSNGPTFGINEEEKYISASLLKLPLAIAIYQHAERAPEILDEKVVYKDKTKIFSTWFDSVTPQKHIEADTPYAVRDLVRYSISYSDNYATHALAALLQGLSADKDLLLETYRELGIIGPTSTLDESMSSKDYASIFRLLYNISYLDKQSSNEILSMLAGSTFDRGLRAGVPEDVVVAHKYGERSGLAGGVEQLHDCGIVYFPHSPYLLCVMTRGHDFSVLQDVIKEISSKVYWEIKGKSVPDPLSE